MPEPLVVDDPDENISLHDIPIYPTVQELIAIIVITMLELFFTKVANRVVVLAIIKTSHSFDFTI